VSKGTPLGSSELRFTELGLASAILAGVQQERILNFMTWEELLKWASNTRGAAKSKSLRELCSALMPDWLFTQK
jgi:hypothetical protein